MGGIVECVLVSLGVVFVTVIAAVLLGIRDANDRRAREDARPVADRIRDIQKDAAFMIEQLERVAERPTPPERSMAWIPPVLEYYHRLEKLASNPTSTPEEAFALADDAGRHVREQRLKGIFVCFEAEQLAKLLSRRRK
jgi:hypothetical protein